MNRLLSSTLVLALSLAGPVFAQTPKQQTAPDNTAVNKRDRDKARPTADQQKGDRSDVEITPTRMITKEQRL